MSEYYTVLYNGENLYAYEMTAEESRILESFRQELMDICNGLEVPRERCFDKSPYMGRLRDNADFVMKYKSGTGYFVLCGDRGVFSLQDGFPAQDKEEAKFILLESEFFMGGLMYELNNRDRLENEWQKKYRAEYDSRKAAFEYAIQMLQAVFKCFPESTAARYTDYMNRWFPDGHWYFDKTRMLFEEIE